MQVGPVRLLHHLVEVVQGAEQGVDGPVVGDVVAEVGHGGGKDGGEPEGGGGEQGEVGEGGGQAWGWGRRRRSRMGDFILSFPLAMWQLLGANRGRGSPFGLWFNKLSLSTMWQLVGANRAL